MKQLSQVPFVWMKTDFVTHWLFETTTDCKIAPYVGLLYQMPKYASHLISGLADFLGIPEVSMTSALREARIDANNVEDGDDEIL